MKKLIIGIGVLVLFGIFLLEGLRDSPEKNILRVTGRVEVDEVLIRTEVPGRVEALFAKEGQLVRKGQPLARIDDEPLVLQEKVLLRTIEAREEALKAKATQIQYLNAQAEAIINQARAALEQSKSKLAQAEIELKRRKSQYERFSKLLHEGVSPKEKFEQIQRAYLQAQEQAEAARAQVRLSEAKLSEAKALWLKVKVLKQETVSLRKELSALRARLNRLRLDLRKTTIKAPVDGLVYRKLTEQGEVLVQMGPVYLLLKPETVHIKTFVPEQWLARIKVGQEVNVYTDAFASRAFKGRICYIADRAEFTPKEIDTSEERVKQVFETKVCFDTPVPELKKGMPVDVVIKPR